MAFIINKFKDDYYSVESSYLSEYEDFSKSKIIPEPLLQIMSDDDLEAVKWIRKMGGFSMLSEKEQRNFIKSHEPESTGWSM